MGMAAVMSTESHPILPPQNEHLSPSMLCTCSAVFRAVRIVAIYYHLIAGQ